MTIYICALCSAELKSAALLGRHIYYFHKEISKEEYAIKHMGLTGICQVCNTNHTKFLNLEKGYGKYCLSCSVKKSWVDKRDKKDQSERMLGNNFSKGRPAGSKNVNKYPMSEKVKKRIRENPCPPWLGKKHSEETKNKMSESVNRAFDNGTRKVNSSMKGVFKPSNPEKYKGDYKNIIYRSSYELKLFRYLDAHPSIEWWQSEELSIPYRSKIDGKMHRYYPDVILKKTDGSVIMIEVKPKYQTVPPDQSKMKTPSGKIKKSYLNEVKTWGVNQSKWEAAEEYCKDRGWVFQIMTEIELGINRKTGSRP